MTFEKIPAELQNLRRWVLWRLEDREGNTTKVPYQPNGAHADVTARQTWNDFATCLRALARGGFSGLGFVFAADEAGYAGVDLDKCRNPLTGITELWAVEILKELDSYAEVSQSGTGWHVIVKNSALPVSGGRKKRVEIYCRDRYFCMTGKRAAGRHEIRSVPLADLYQRMVEDKLDPLTPAPLQGKRREGRDLTPSGTDYRIIASLARKLRTDDPSLVESEIARRYPERYRSQREKHGRRNGKTYWHYSIVRHFDRLSRRSPGRAA